MRHLVLFTLLIAMAIPPVHGDSWRPSRELLRAIRLVESSDGRFPVGDQGGALGDFQLTEAAWLDVSSWRKRRRLKVYDYREYALHPFINRTYAADYLAILYRRFKKRLGREPTPGELYAAYNMGFGSFAQCKFRLARVNPVTRQKCEIIMEIMRNRDS